jgi:hypothetical protein
MLFVCAAWLYAPLLVRSMTRCEITFRGPASANPCWAAAVGTLAPPRLWSCNPCRLESLCARVRFSHQSRSVVASASSTARAFKHEAQFIEMACFCAKQARSGAICSPSRRAAELV